MLHPNVIETTFFLPDNMINSDIDPDKIQAKLLSLYKDIEIRVNQRMLLKQLEETGKVSNLLVGMDSDNNELNDKAPRDRIKKRFTRLATINKSLPHQKPIDKSQVSFKLSLQHVNHFLVSDRLAKNESINSLVSKFAIPPFLIVNRDEIYQLVQDSDVFVFKFAEREQEKPMPPSEENSPTNKRSSGALMIRTVELEIYGIDAPSKDTIEKLEQRVQEQLQQISLFKLADSLIKNQKNIMTLSDSQFIRGNQPPIIIMFPINPIISDLDTLVKYTKQNLMRFLVIFQIRDMNKEKSSVLVYNYLNIIEGSQYRSHSPVFKSRSETKQAQFLGNTWGKALALIYIDAFYYNGETLNVYNEFKQNSLRPES